MHFGKFVPGEKETPALAELLLPETFLCDLQNKSLSKYINFFQINPWCYRL
jgi:hypothetical protein